MRGTRNNCFGSKNVVRRCCCTFLLLFGTRAYLFSPDEGSWYIFSTRNNCCEFFASYGVIIQSVAQSFLKTPVCGASLTYILVHFVMRKLFIPCIELPQKSGIHFFLLDSITRIIQIFKLFSLKGEGKTN